VFLHAVKTYEPERFKKYEDEAKKYQFSISYQYDMDSMKFSSLGFQHFCSKVSASRQNGIPTEFTKQRNCQNLLYKKLANALGMAPFPPLPAFIQAPDDAVVSSSSDI
jgi:hypothetical protein